MGEDECFEALHEADGYVLAGCGLESHDPVCGRQRYIVSGIWA